MTADPIENLEFQIDELRKLRSDMHESDLVMLTRIDTIIANLNSILLDLRNQRRVSLRGGHYA